MESGEDDSECAACVTETSKGSASSPVNRIVAERGEAVRLGMAVARSVASLSLVIVIHAASQVAVHAAASVVTTRSNDSPSALNVSEEGSTLSEGVWDSPKAFCSTGIVTVPASLPAHADRSGAPCIRFIGCRGDTDGKVTGTSSERAVRTAVGRFHFYRQPFARRFDFPFGGCRREVQNESSSLRIETSVSGVTLNVGAEASGGCGS